MPTAVPQVAPRAARQVGWPVVPDVAGVAAHVRQLAQRPSCFATMKEEGWERLIYWELFNKDSVYEGGESDFNEVRALWLAWGALPSETHLNNWQLHPKMPDSEFSTFSTDGSYILADKFAMADVDTAVRTLTEVGWEVKYVSTPDEKQKRTFHGTTFLSFLKILRSGGMIPGPNGHSFRRRHFKGVFSASSVAEAFERVDHEQGVDEQNVLHPCAMPVVLELECGELRRYHSSRRDLFVTPGSEGCVLPVAKIVRVHISLRRLENFWQLAEAGKVRRMGLVGGYGKVCCGQGNQSFTTCGMLLPEDSGELYKSCERSNAGIWYCKECMQRVRGGGFFV